MKEVIHRQIICFKRSRRGFTLVELMVTIVVIGLLAAALVINLNNFRERGRDNKRKADLASISIALEGYYTKNRAYPDSGSNIWSSATGSSTWILPLFNDKFFQAIPKDPINSSTYHYEYRSTSLGREYKLEAVNMETTEGKKWAREDGGDSNDSYELFSSGGSDL